MADEANGNVVEAPPSVTLTPLALPGQPSTDKGFVTEAGTKIRVRVVAVDRQETQAPTNTDVAVAASGYVLSVTCAKLNDDLTVASDESGALLIMNKHEVILSDAAMSNPDFDPIEAIKTTLGQEAYKLEQRVSKRAATADYLASEWGFTLPEPAKVEPLSPVISEPDPA